MKLVEWLGSCPELIMYDLDGTLVDSVPDLSIALGRTLREFNLPDAGPAKTRLWVGNGIPSLVRRALADDLMGDKPGVVDSETFEKAYQLFKHYYDEEVGQHSCLYPGVYSFLNQMARLEVKQAIVTNKSDLFTEKLLSAMEIDRLFDLCLSGDSLDEKKPHPMPLLHAITYFGVSRSASIMIGDSVNDVKAARAADVKVIGLPYGYNHGRPIESAEPDCVVASLTELL